MSRRRSVRRARRVQVQFWKLGDPHAYPGYTTNISTTGMFVATHSPVPQGTRVRIEVLDRDRGFIVEGVVAHARKVRGELMRVSQPGMGIQFLTVEELVRGLVPVINWGEEEIPEGPLDSVRDIFGEPALPELAAEPESPRPAPAAGAPPPREPEKLLDLTPPLRPERRPAPEPGSGGVFSLRFGSSKEFLEIFRRDILNGGLFVPTRYPAQLQEVVSIDLEPPAPFTTPVRLRARVVQRFDPRSADLDGTNLLSGMGVELLDLPGIVERLRPVVERFKT